MNKILFLITWFILITCSLAISEEVTFNDMLDHKINHLIEEHNAISYEEKFKRMRHSSNDHFIIGDKVIAPVSINFEGSSGSKIKFVVSTNDIRYSDTFIVPVDLKQFKTYRSLSGAFFLGVFVITGKREYMTSLMYKFPAELVHIEKISIRNSDNVNSLRLGTPVIYTGVITGINNFDHTRKIITLKTTDSRKLFIHASANTSYKGSIDYDGFSGEKLEVGDLIQLTTLVITLKFDEYDLETDSIVRKSELGKYINTLIIEKSGSVKRKIPYSKIAYLIQPNEARLKEYKDFRRKSSDLLSLMESDILKLKFIEVRNYHSHLMKLELISSELESFNRLISLMPEQEKPIQIWDRNRANTINKAFHSDIDRMTKKMFYEFALNQLSTLFLTRKNKIDDKVDTMYLVQIMEEAGLTQSEIEEILTIALDVRLKYFRSQMEKGEKFNREIENNDHLFLERGLDYLSIKKLIDFSIKILESENVTKRYNYSGILHEGVYTLWKTVKRKKNRKVYGWLLREYLSDFKKYRKKLAGIPQAEEYSHRKIDEELGNKYYQEIDLLTQIIDLIK